MGRVSERENLTEDAELGYYNGKGREKMMAGEKLLTGGTVQ